ncbi:MAG TPA: hypothetical protein VF812_14135 [Ktedonobacterales bacterium]
MAQDEPASRPWSRDMSHGGRAKYAAQRTGQSQYSMARHPREQ